MSKALGSMGGFVAGSARLARHLRNHARTLIYSTGLPPAAAAAAHRALQIVATEPWRRDHLHALARHLRAELVSRSCPATPGEGPIVPVVVGDPIQATTLATHLQAAGYLVPAIRPPTVPAGTSRLRISLCTAHRMDEVAHLAAVLGVKMAGA